MIYAKPNPVGIDTVITQLQQYLHAGLLSEWDSQATGYLQDGYSCYGRAQRVWSKTGTVPEVFKSGIDYIDPMTDDDKVLTSFFGMGASNKVDAGRSMTELHLIFCVNLVRIQKYANTSYRTDEEVRQDVLSVLKVWHGLAEITSVELWPDNVFREYSATRTGDLIKDRDRHPNHIFRVNLRVRYENSNC